MKRLIVLVLIVSLGLTSVAAQTVRGQSMNGSTGLFGIPTGRIGWETGGNVGMDIGYKALINNSAGTTHIPALTFSLFKWVELSAAFDIQPDQGNYKNEDLLFGFKLKLPTANTAIALGVNVQLLNFADDYADYNAYQPYMALTYPGTFFTMKAETTIVFGKTFYSHIENNSDIDFGMGFDLILFPDVFGNMMHWIIDFANFSYSGDAWPYNPAGYRGVLNTGFRFDLSALPAMKKYKFLIDVIFIDLFDDGHRSFSIGATFGLPL